MSLSGSTHRVIAAGDVQRDCKPQFCYASTPGPRQIDFAAWPGSLPALATAVAILRLRRLQTTV